MLGLNSHARDSTVHSIPWQVQPVMQSSQLAFGSTFALCGIVLFSMFMCRLVGLYSS